MNPNVKVGPANYFGSGGATSLDKYGHFSCGLLRYRNPL